MGYSLLNRNGNLITRSGKLLTEYISDMNPIWNGLKGYWRMDETTGDNILDALGISNGSTVTADIELVGKHNACRYFAAGDIATVPHTTTISIANNVTFSLWTKPMYSGGQGGFIAYKGSYPGYNYRLVYYATTQFEFACALNGTFFAISSLGISYPAGTWYHVVGQYENGVGQKIYVNASLRGSNSNVGTLNTNTEPLYIGKYHGGGYDYTGYIDEIAVWDRALSQTEITELYNAGSGIFY